MRTGRAGGDPRSHGTQNPEAGTVSATTSTPPGSSEAERRLDAPFVSEVTHAPTGS
jgi:hypothetical protein